MRVAEDLPFIPTAAIKLLLRSALARSNRGERVKICHFLWQANHLHIIFVVKDKLEAVKFYMELRRKITEYIKRLTGKRRLKLWEERPSIIYLVTVHDVVERIAYIYSNPSKDHLVDTISKYPGYSTYEHLLTALNKGNDYEISETTPYISFSSIEPIGDLVLPSGLGVRLANELRKKATIKHELVIAPNAWIKCYEDEGLGISPIELNQLILKSLKQREEAARNERSFLGRTVMGVQKLISQPFMTRHTPRRKDNRIYVICHDRVKRISHIQFIKGLAETFKELYKKACEGIHVEYPPGTFKPPIPSMANAICL